MSTNHDTIMPGHVVTTRYFGGYERVDVLQVHESYFVVSRFGGAASDILPKDKIEKVLRASASAPKEERK